MITRTPLLANLLHITTNSASKNCASSIPKTSTSSEKVNISEALLIVLQSIDIWLCDTTFSLSYLFSIDGINFTTQDQYYNMSAGTYTVAIQDSNGCVTSDVRTITEPTAISSIANINNVLCYGSVDGEISIFTTGGVPPYTYSFQGMTFSSTNIFVGLAAGSYFISTMDQNGCVDTNQYTITSPSLILSNLITTNETSILKFQKVLPDILTQMVAT